jgi:hypothetical protein
MPLDISSGNIIKIDAVTAVDRHVIYITSEISYEKMRKIKDQHGLHDLADLSYDYDEKFALCHLVYEPDLGTWVPLILISTSTPIKLSSIYKFTKYE